MFCWVYQFFFFFVVLMEVQSGKLDLDIIFMSALTRRKADGWTDSETVHVQGNEHIKCEEKNNVVLGKKVFLA